MPTGYTCIIEDGDPTFEEYVWRCARAFGAFADMREEPMDAKLSLKKEEPSYHQAALVKEQKYYNKLLKMSSHDIKAEALREYDERLRYYEEANTRFESENRKYRAMLKKIDAWVPPTEEHTQLKKFMRDQIEISLPTAPTKPEPSTPKAWLKRSIENSKWSIDYHKEGLEKDAEHKENRTDWISALAKSVPIPKNLLP